MVSVTIPELFADEINAGIDIFAGGRTSVDYSELSSRESETIRKVFRNKVNMIERISPTLAASLRAQETVFVKYGGIAKAIFPEDRPIRYPSESGSIGVDFIFPQALKYAADADAPCYTDYEDNTWNIKVTADEDGKINPVNILGKEDKFYRANPATDKHTLMVIAKDGFVEVGNTPRFDQIKIQTDVQDKYAPMTAQPLYQLPIEKEVPIYQHSTLGVIPVYHNMGTKITAQATSLGTSQLIPLGMVFYEHDFFEGNQFKTI